jgi:hypothetical protein
MELLRLKCPVCHSSDIQYHSLYTTKNHGDRVIYSAVVFWRVPHEFSSRHGRLLLGE